MDIDVGTRALIKLFVLPPGLLLLILAVGWLFARQRAGRLLLLAGILALYGLSTPVGVNWLASHVETVPALGENRLKNSSAEAILVFLANLRRDNPELGGADALSALSLERMDHAVALHRRTGLPLVLSGGSVNGDTEELASVAARWLRERFKMEPIALELKSRDTWENARFSADVLKERGLSRVLLVTHAYHMPRALLGARAAGIDAVPAPFAFEHSPAEPRGPARLGNWLPRAGYLGRSYLILHEMLGLIWYRLAYL